MKKRPATSSNPLPAPTPVQAPFKSIRSCSNCISRKTKCSPSTPYCGPCWSGGRTDECDIEEHIVLPYSAAKERESGEEERRKRIDWLEGEMGRRTGTDVAGISTGSRIEEPTRELRRVPVDPLSLELGMLALDSSGAPSRSAFYVGTASGLTITRLLSAVLHCENVSDFEHPSETEPSTGRGSPISAGIPPRAIAAAHLVTYLNRIHRYLPFIPLRTICRVFDARYVSSPTALDRSRNSYFERFLFFAVLAIGAAESRSTASEPQDAFTPSEYLQAALPLIPQIGTVTDLNLLSAILLLVVYGVSAGSDPSINLWLYTGHAMRIAIELGLTRPVSAWDLTPGEKEDRRRIWWCTYRLERIVAVRLGRVLSIRNEGIDAEWPTVLDEITPECSLCADPVELDYRAGLHLVRLSRIYGEILESVYIARPVNRPSMTIDETLQRVWTIQNALVEWANLIPTIAAQQSPDSNVLTLAFHRACLLLHRPSPSFPNQPENVHSVCIRSARAGINLSSSMFRGHTLSRNWQNFHDLFLDGLVLMFSSWSSPSSTGAITSLLQATDPDLALCGQTLLDLSKSLHPPALRYVSAFDKIVSCFRRLLGIGAVAGVEETDEFFFDWSIFESMDGFALEQGAVEMIRTLANDVQDP